MNESFDCLECVGVFDIFADFVDRLDFPDDYFAHFVRVFASELFLNTSYLSTLFKKEVGMTLTDYVNANRIEYAKKLLRSTLLPVQDVAAACGIPDVHYFTRLFRRITGMTPREWRR